MHFLLAGKSRGHTLPGVGARSGHASTCMGLMQSGILSGHFCEQHTWSLESLAPLQSYLLASRATVSSAMHAAPASGTATNTSMARICTCDVGSEASKGAGWPAGLGRPEGGSLCRCRSGRCVNVNCQANVSGPTPRARTTYRPAGHLHGHAVGRATVWGVSVCGWRALTVTTCHPSSTHHGCHGL